MEEQILRIIVKNIGTESPSDNSAKEITSHVMPFTLWCIIKAQGSELSVSPSSIIFNNRIFTPDELYNYWLTNVKK